MIYSILYESENTLRVNAMDYIVDVLTRNGVDTIFGYTGGNIVHMIDAIAKAENMSFVENNNEQASAFAACAYAYTHETIGVALSSSGPGAINLISGIANAFYDSLPCLFLTGTVNVAAMNTAPSVRQSAFQETDIVSIIKPITKYAVTIKDPDDIPSELEKAIHIAQSGRKGPVLLNLPHDVQRSCIEVTAKIADIESIDPICTHDVKKAIDEIQSAKRPIVIVGGGMAQIKSRELSRQFVELLALPVVASLRGLDVLPHDHPNYIGMIGSYGNRYANMAVAYSDVLLVLGSRLDCRQIEPSSPFFQGKKVIHIDIDESELKRTVFETISIHAHADDFLSTAIEYATKRKVKSDFSKWIKVLHRWKERYVSYTSGNPVYLTNAVIHSITETLGDDLMICADVGQNQMCVAQSSILKKGSRFISSAGHGAMGFGLPAAIGVSFTHRHGTIICCTGDGGIQMNLQELQTVDSYDLPIHVLILNNRCLGMIRDYQSKILPDRYYGSVIGYSAPDFERLAHTFNFPFLAINSEEEIEKAMELLRTKRRSMIEVRLPEQILALPDLGRGMYDQYPYLTEEQKFEVTEDLADA